MLPDIRAVIAAIVTALGLLTLSFGMVAAFRVAQDDRAGFLHAELAQRGRQPLPAGATPGTILIVDTSPMTVAPMLAAELPVPVAANPAPVVIETKAEAESMSATPVAMRDAEASQPVMVAAAAPVFEAPAIQEREIALPPSGVLPVGGPFAEIVPPSAQNSIQQSAAVQRAARAAAIKKARAVRLARERRIVARRAAAARRAQQTSTAAFGWNNPQTNYSYDSFNNGSFGNSAVGTKTRQPATRQPATGL
ncbi:MAG: hypothetical protein V7608_1633 [Hyphomicrobiales bacterium]|jgi:hypothetical protein